ncbi:MAG: hypothetical protein AAFY70_10325 [Bacteroidota bacterium]
MAKQKTRTFLGIKINPQYMRKKGSGWVILDLVMLLLLAINIVLFIFHWIYGYYRVETLMETQLPEVHQVLFPIYQEFPFIDLIFLTIFISEFILRWIVAIVQKTYHQWFFYPFIHWYDLLGCIPFGSFRFLRILRFFALTYKLQRLEVLDFRDTYMYDRYKKYRAILMEEIADRVVVHVLNGIRYELKEGLPITDRILNEVILPHKSELIHWLSQRLQMVTQRSYRLYQKDLQDYVYLRIEEAVAQNKEIKQLGQIPVLGTKVSQTLESAIQDIVFQVLNGILQDIAGGGTGRMMDELSEITLNTLIEKDLQAQDEGIHKIMSSMVLSSLDMIKSHVELQEWKLREKLRQEDGELAAAVLFDERVMPQMPLEREADAKEKKA